VCVLKTLTNTIKNTPGFETLRTIICGNDHLRFCGIRLCVFKLALSSASSSVLLLLGFRMTILLIKGLSLPGITLLSLLKNTYILGFSSTKNYVTCTVGAHWLVSAWGGRAAGISGTAYAKELSGFELKSARQRVINLTVSSVKQFIARTPSPLFFPSPPPVISCHRCHTTTRQTDSNLLFLIMSKPGGKFQKVHITRRVHRHDLGFLNSLNRLNFGVFWKF
jgi:hypothetical protein